jgi:hypothetical protein
MINKKEIIKTKADISKIGAWASCLYDMFEADKKRIEERLYLLCEDKFINPHECKPIIKELMERI